MKLLQLVAVLMSVVFMSCSKSDLSAAETSQLQGSWRMVQVETNNGQKVLKPVSEIGNVDITFNTKSTNSGLLTGVTPRNEIGTSQYQITADQKLMVDSFTVSNDETETAWGKEFVANFTSNSNYSFDCDGMLCIKSNGKTLVFKRII